MLTVVTSPGQLRFGELMEVYADSNREKASDWPNLPPLFALELAEQDHRQYLREVFFRTPGAILAVWEENGQYVSALRLEPYKDGLLLEGLETAPEHRKKGYAASLICCVQGYLRQQGAVKLYSHVSRGNKPSQKTHEVSGFRQIADCAVYINGSVDYRGVTLLYEA